MTNKQTIGILGGIGVDASIYFYQELVKRFRLKKKIQSNTDYPQIIINSVPAPELHLEEHDAPNILQFYIEGVKELESHNLSHIVMACNTIHAFLPQIKEQLPSAPIVNLPELVFKKLKALKAHNICILGTGLTVSRRLYHSPHMHYVDLEPSQYEELCEVVVSFNNGGSEGDALKKNKETLNNLIKEQQAKGAEFFVFACTEVSEILHGELEGKSLDTLELLIDHSVDLLLP